MVVVVGLLFRGQKSWLSKPHDLSSNPVALKELNVVALCLQSQRSRKDGRQRQKNDLEAQGANEPGINRSRDKADPSSTSCGERPPPESCPLTLIHEPW